MRKLIDVWDLETFDGDLMATLSAHVDLVRNYMTTSQRIYLEREASDHTMPYPLNPYGASYIEFVDAIGRDMESRTIRAWHHTRLMDPEAAAIRSEGIHISTMETLRRRLDAQVTAGTFSAEVADALFAASPFQSDQHRSRSDKFWMTSHPRATNDSGVELLLGNWGGEATYFWLRDPTLETLVASLGAPRVLELAVPLAVTRHAYSAGEAVVATFGRFLGCSPDKKAFDLYSTHPLPPSHVIAIHTAGEADFTALGRGYPAGYVEVNIERWDQLEGDQAELES